ncbi:hypothetical protein Tco_0188071 [Tanacetum coccineum]
MIAAEFYSLMEREGYTIKGDYLQAKLVSVIQLSDGQHKRIIGPAVIAGKLYPIGTSNASLSSSTHNSEFKCKASITIMHCYSAITLSF